MFNPESSKESFHEHLKMKASMYYENYTAFPKVQGPFISCKEFLFTLSDSVKISKCLFETLFFSCMFYTNIMFAK